jgi:hypothetical protein
VPSVSSPAKRLKKLAAERSKLKCSASTARGDAKISRLLHDSERQPAL